MNDHLLTSYARMLAGATWTTWGRAPLCGNAAIAGYSQERIAIGETPNLAARLQETATPGEVVIAASTRRLKA